MESPKAEIETFNFGGNKLDDNLEYEYTNFFYWLANAHGFLNNIMGGWKWMDVDR